MSSYEQTRGLVVKYFQPLVRGGAYIGDLDFSEYSHEHRAIGGFYSASIGMPANESIVNDWIQAGLGRHIEVQDETLSIAWSGFVNKVEAVWGRTTASVGPLLSQSFGNRVRVRYAIKDTSTSPPTVGVTLDTIFAEDTESQELYGILEQTMSGGTITTDDANQYRDTWLAEHAYPETSQDLVLGGQEPSISLELLGYWNWLDTYYYADSNLGTIAISDKIIAVADYEPNGVIFSGDYSRVSDNPWLVGREENDDRTGMTIVTALVALGDANDRKYNAGVYEGRRLVYEQVPTDYSYKLRVADNVGVTDRLDGELSPWRVRAGKKIFLPDYLVGAFPPLGPATRKKDPRLGFIETASFTAPDDLRLNGVPIGEIDQFAAKLGIGGTGG